MPLSSQSDTPFDQDPDYTWSLDAEQNTVANLWNVTVTVTRSRGDGGKLETKLTEMIIDPSIRGTSYDSALTATLMPPSSTGGGAGAGGAAAPAGQEAQRAAARVVAARVELPKAAGPVAAKPAVALPRAAAQVGAVQADAVQGAACRRQRRWWRRSRR